MNPAGGAAPGDAPADGSDATRDSKLLLHRWRRLDWRFLLPVAAADAIVYGGQPDDELLDALPLLGRVHRVVSVEDWTTVSGSCDLVVLVRPTSAELEAALSTVRPGGWVYAEIRRSWPGLGRPGTLLGWRRAFRRAGLTDVAAHWHAPNFAACSRMISVDGRTALTNALLRHQAVRFGVVFSVLGRLAVAAGVFPAAVPEGSVVGQCPATRAVRR